MLKYIPQIPHLSQTKQRVVHRVIAKLIDLFLIIFVSALIAYPIGPLVGFFYSLLADGIPPRGFWLQHAGQSVGKRLMRLRVLHRGSGLPMDFRVSALRNAPVAVATFFAIIPVWGWLILALVGIPLMILEISLMWRSPTGQRLGDVMADTEVVSLDAPGPSLPTQSE